MPSNGQIQRIACTINGAEIEREIDPRTNLADFLRRDLGLTGTHVGCEHGVCGACTVLLDGRSVRACLLFAVQANGKAVTTVEALATDGKLNPLQAAFRRHHALQCGFCTPGFLMTLTDVLDTNPEPTEADLREVLSGNLCRCTGYQNIVDAALAAAEELRGGVDA
jgi:aerobic carbon-monoxide dehydrogenase small subunit